MEYEKQIKRLVLGYLKTECRSSYRRFLRIHFHNANKHVATRVAGQTLEDILRIYSRVQDIVQGRLEDTDFFSENGAEFSSPIYLADQLLYLLDKEGRAATPVSTIHGRSSYASSVAESHFENTDFTDHISNVETTPEHTLPGNIISNDYSSDSRTPFRRRSPIFKTPYLEKLPTSDQENISSVMSMKLLQKRELHEKLAQNINTALTTPELLSSSRKGEEIPEIEDTIKHALSRIEADPIFEDLLEDFLDPVVNTIGKVITTEAGTSLRSPGLLTPFKSSTKVEEHINGAVSSILAVSSLANQPEVNNRNQSVNDNVPNKGAGSLPVVLSTNHLGGTFPVSAHIDASINTQAESEQLSHKEIASDHISVVSSEQVQVIGHHVLQATNGTIPSTTITQAGAQQQQFFIVNQPLVISRPGPWQLIQPTQTVSQPIILDGNPKLLPKPSSELTQEDIMAMPTIILNERNEVTYADPGGLTVNTPPYKMNEVHNIKEYLNAFGSSDLSPVIKKQPKKKNPVLKPAPVIKVEVFHRNSPLRCSNENVEAGPSTTVSNPTTGLSNLDSVFDCDGSPENRSEDTSNKTISNEKNKPKSLDPICTPPPLVRKPTPKSSSHVRNLTFPSPFRKTPSDKPDANGNSPSTLSKQQATKDLFKDTSEGESEPKESPKNKPMSDENSKKSESLKPKSPKKQNVSSNAAKPTRKPPKRHCKKEQDYLQSWDAALRKNLPPVRCQIGSNPTKKHVKKTIKPATELDVSDPDGKKLEEALKTPTKPGKTPSKTPSKKKRNVQKPKPEKKLDDVEEETKVEPKKVLSPSKVCNSASKRNMDVDGITPVTSKESTHQLVSNARKNITTLLETPGKEGGTQPSPEVTLDVVTTPFTPMLKANLKDFTTGDNFAIDTPDFPVTPGSSLVENSGTAYCILNDTETNKATEAIVFSEERKSSVRKTDEEDFEMSPKVYGCKDVLDDFNKSRAGQKNLELLDNRGVKWDASSDKESKSDHSEDETSNVVIQNSLPMKKRAARSCIQSGKDGASDQQDDGGGGAGPLEMSSNEQLIVTPEDQKTKGGRVDKSTEHRSPGSGSSSDSEIISKRNFQNKSIETDSENDENLESTCAEHRPYTDNDEKNTNQTRKSKRSARSRLEEAKSNNKAKENICKNKAREPYSGDISSVTAESIRNAVLTVSLENRPGYILSSSYSLKAEIEEKKRRVIELEKAKSSQPVKTPARRKSVKARSKSPKNKRKQSIPTKRAVCTSSDEEPDDIDTSSEKVDSQDEFFIKSGSNLHRRTKQVVSEHISDKVEHLGKQEADKRNVNTETESRSRKSASESDDNSKDVKALPSADIDQKTPEEINKTTESELDDANDSFWDECACQAQPEEIVIVYDELNTSQKCLEEYKLLNLEKVKLKAAVPLVDGSPEQVLMEVTPFKVLWEIEPCASNDNGDDASVVRATADFSSDSEHAGPKVGDIDELRNSKKRKHRSDSCNSNSSSKRMKTSILPSYLNENNIEKLLTKLHGPSDKT